MTWIIKYDNIRAMKKKQQQTDKPIAPPMKKTIEFTPTAWKFYTEQPDAVRREIDSRIDELATNGRLAEPHGKAIAPNLFEIRVRVSPKQYRLFYCYFDPNGILILSGFVKKTQATPIQEIRKAQKIRREALI